MTGIIFHVPPVNQGQIVEVAYGASNGVVIKRIHDRSDKTTSYYRSKMLASDYGDYWNSEPENARWKQIEIKEVTL
jgi:hypothetical protein